MDYSSNQGIAVNPKFDYSVVEVGDRRYVVGTDRLSAVAEILAGDSYKTVQHLKGTDMEYMVAKHPLHRRPRQPFDGSCLRY